MENDVVQKQLLARAFSTSYIATEVLPKGISELFPDSEMYRTFAIIFNRYYQSNDETMTLETLKMKVADKVDILVKARKINDTEEINYFNFIDTLNKTEIDNTKEMSLALNKYVRNALVSQAIIQSASSLSGDSNSDVLKDLQDELDDINSLDITGTGSKVLSVYDDTEEKVDIYQELGKAKLPTGITEIDKATDDGLARGEVGMIAASSGFGKTSILSNIAVSYVRQRVNVFYVSLEELRSRMLLRFDRITMNTSVKTLLDDSGHIKKTYGKLSQAVYNKMKETTGLGKLAFFKSSPQTITISHLQQVIQANMRSSDTKYDVVVLDYPDLLLNPSETGNEAKDGGRIFEELRKMAQDLDVVLWTATQLNRSANGQEIKTMASVEGSYRKLNTCEFVCTLNRTPEEYDEGFLRLHIDKNRNKEGFLGDTLYLKYVTSSGVIRDETDVEHERHLDLINSEATMAKAERQKFYANKQDDKVKKANERISQYNSQVV